MKPSPPSVPAATPVPWHCLGHLSPSRVPRPPLAWGPCSWEGYESRAHHTLRCDLHLAGTGSGSPSFTAGEAEGIELGSPLGLLCTTVTEVPEQIMCWRKCVCLWHYHPSVPYAGAICPDWEQEPARKSENLTVVRVQASGKYIIPGHGNAANPFNQTQQGCAAKQLFLGARKFTADPLYSHIPSVQTLKPPRSFPGGPFVTSAVCSLCSSTCCYLLPPARHRVCLMALFQQQCFWKSVVDLRSAHVNILQRAEKEN